RRGPGWRKRCGGTSLPASHVGTVAATGSTVGRAVAAGVVVGVAATAAVAATSGGGMHKPRPHVPSDEAAAYIANWRRSQLATWKVSLHWQRTVGSNRLEDEIHIAQRPPDRLSEALGSVDARRGDRRLACAAGADGRLRCRDAGAAPPYGQE